MATFRILSSGGFDPDAINALTIAYEHACAALDVVDRTDPLKELIANAIIERARTGERVLILLAKSPLFTLSPKTT
jgi:hypothetical protein